MTDLKQVEQWYEKNQERLASTFSVVKLNRKEWDPLRGGVVIELEGPTLVASLAFWFKGDVSISALKRGSQNPLMLDDRVIDSGEDVGLLLDGYLREIEGLV